MERVTIRTARLDDVADLTEIFRLASLSNERDREQLLAHPEVLELDVGAVVDGRVRLAEIDHRGVGFATSVPGGRTAELDDLFVHPDWMRRGVATALIADALELARVAGIERIEVTANDHAMAFYRRVGFVEDDPIETELGVGTRMHLPVPANVSLDRRRT